MMSLPCLFVVQNADGGHKVILYCFIAMKLLGINQTTGIMKHLGAKKGSMLLYFCMLPFLFW